MMRIGHYRPVHVKSVEAQLIRTTLQARRQIVATLLQLQGTIRGLLRMHGLKIGEIHRNQFDKRVRDLLKDMPTSEIGRLNPRIPSWGSSNARPRTEARSRGRREARGQCLFADGFMSHFALTADVTRRRFPPVTLAWDTA
jgi:hypothetical protein